MRQKSDEMKVELVFDWRNEIAKGAETGMVSVRIYQNRVRKYISTGVRVRAMEWDGKKVVRREDAVVLNKMIQEQLAKCKNVTAVAVGDAVQGGSASRAMAFLPDTSRIKVDRSEASFLDWMRKQIDECGLAQGTVRHHNTVYEALCEFGKIRRFEDVRAERLNEWIRWIGKRKVSRMVDGKEVKVNIDQVTIYGYWKRVRKWIGVAQSLKLIAMDAMCGVKVEKGKNKEREFLTDGELQMLMDAQIASPCLSKIRDLFLIECGCGLAFQDMMDADFHRLEKMGEWWTLQGRRQKTKEQYFLVLLGFAYERLQRYEFDVPRISNQKYNKYLKEVMEVVGIEKHVTSHVGRHTYACYCLRHGVRIEAVQRTLGHSSIKTTQIYAKLVDNDVVEAFGKMK